MRLTDEQINDIITTDYYDYSNVEPDNKGEDLIDIESLPLFDALFDKKRKENGYLPLFDDSGEYDDIGWYSVYIRVNVNTQKAESIVAWTECTEDDDRTVYEEPFDDEETQIKVYNRLVEYLGEDVFYAYKEDDE